jgi:hypothetical protein
MSGHQQKARRPGAVVASNVRSPAKGSQAWCCGSKQCQVISKTHINIDISKSDSIHLFQSKKQITYENVK